MSQLSSHRPGVFIGNDLDRVNRHQSFLRGARWNCSIPKPFSTHWFLTSLRAAGWTSKRVSTDVYERAFAEEGINLSFKAREFLRRFGGLIIRYESNSHQKDALEFFADRAVVGMADEGIKNFEHLIGIAPLCPIGHYLFGTCMLFMDVNGRVFGGSDTTLTSIGNTGEEAIANILNGSPIEILEPQVA